MRNKELVAIFNEIADLLELQQEQSFRVNSYRRAARTIHDQAEDIEILVSSGRVGELPGIGKATVDKITQFLTGGKIDLHVELLAQVPAGLPELLRIPGLGPKKASRFWKEFGIACLDDLKSALEGGKFVGAKGLGEKTLEQIKQGIAFASSSVGRTPLGIAWAMAEDLAERVRRIEDVKRVEIAGSLRRGSETVGDLDLVCVAADGEAVVTAFTQLAQVDRVLASGPTKGSVMLVRPDGAQIQTDLRVVPEASFGAAMQYFTGSKEHNVRLREMAVKKKWRLNEWGLFDGEDVIAGKTEASIYAKLGLPCYPPEMREDRGEFDIKELEPLIQRSDIRGDLHMHTTASDGTLDAPQMAEAAHAFGYEYIAITDHSKSSAIANGLSIDRMWRQIEKLRKLNETLDGITVLIGCECDILADGSLDYPDQVLAACDLVVASVHSGMKQAREKVTGRLLAAMDNPYVTIMGHPTARLINKREPMDLDMAAVVAKAAETGTALELNSSWQRLDLNDVHLRMAREAGVMVSIDTDAHASQQLDQMRFGIATARRAWLRPANVINTMHLPTLRKWIAKKRKKRK